MKLKDIASQLANRINQPAVIEVYLRQVYAKGFIDGTKQSPWISAKDRLPEANTKVLTKGTYGFLICSLSTLDEWETGANVYEERLAITHWMPIPDCEEG